ncbi:MAG: hypothetical protein WB676_30610, partial [Bryobacteraceae bacterium]
MNEFRITPQVLINVVIAASLVLLFSSAPFGFLTTIGGIALLLILFSYDQGARRSVFQSLAFSAVCGLSVVLAAGIGLQRMAARKDLDVWFAGVWLCATVVAMAIDRARMSARAAIGVAPEVFAPAPRPAAHPAPATRYGLGLGGAVEAAPPEATPAAPPPPVYTPSAP